MIGITLGDPSGIGPETIAKAIFILETKGIDVRDKAVFIGPEKIWNDSGLTDINSCWTGSQGKGAIHPGKPDENTGRLAFRSVEIACELLRQGTVTSLLTLPVSKEWICKGTGKHFSGHTEYLAEKAGIDEFGMMLANSHFAVYLISTHLPLVQVPGAITAQKIISKVQLLIDTLPGLENVIKRRDRIAVCGLNPHSGEGGRLGCEEIEIIGPAIEALNSRNNVQIDGPYPADTVFVKALKKEYGVIVCMYHDQALIPLKTTDPDHAVNLTLGLPYLRTSPGHGTAFDIAGKGRANSYSTLQCLKIHLERFITGALNI